MENAAKALLIAGSIFLAIALITFGIYIYQSMHNMANAQDEKRDQEQLVAFNKKYEAYNKSVMYGTEIITVMNMAIEDNKKIYNATDLNNLKINIDFEFEVTDVYIYNTETGRRDQNSTAAFIFRNEYNIATYASHIKTNTERFNDFKRRIFKCDNIDYDPQTGRVYYMHFTEQKLNDYTHK